MNCVKNSRGMKDKEEKFVGLKKKENCKETWRGVIGIFDTLSQKTERKGMIDTPWITDRQIEKENKETFCTFNNC